MIFFSGPRRWNVGGDVFNKVHFSECRKMAKNGGKTWQKWQVGWAGPNRIDRFSPTLPSRLAKSARIDWPSAGNDLHIQLCLICIRRGGVRKCSYVNWTNSWNGWYANEMVIPLIAPVKLFPELDWSAALSPTLKSTWMICKWGGIVAAYFEFCFAMTWSSRKFLGNTRRINLPAVLPHSFAYFAYFAY